MSWFSEAFGTNREHIRRERARRREAVEHDTKELRDLGLDDAEIQEIINATIGRARRESHRKTGFSGLSYKTRCNVREAGGEIAAGLAIAGTVAQAVPVIGTAAGAVLGAGAAGTAAWQQVELQRQSIEKEKEAKLARLKEKYLATAEERGTAETAAKMKERLAQEAAEIEGQYGRDMEKLWERAKEIEENEKAGAPAALQARVKMGLDDGSMTDATAGALLIEEGVEEERAAAMVDVIKGMEPLPADEAAEKQGGGMIDGLLSALRRLWTW